MRIAVLGAGGARTPLIVQAMIIRQARLGLARLALMDIDRERLDLMRDVSRILEAGNALQFQITDTDDPRSALEGADFVITTFRIGGTPSRVIDERVPLAHGVVGQETTGPGGFAMAMRGIPVLLRYLDLMREVCPGAWLVNFANPAGLLTQAATTVGGWQRAVGICDAPHAMRRVAAALLGASVEEVFLDYFGLNHLGWVRAVMYHGRDVLPDLIPRLATMEGLPGLPFEPGFVASLGMIPNEYLYYYYHADEAVANIRNAAETRGEQVARLNGRLDKELRRLRQLGNLQGMASAYAAYVRERGESYMVSETGSVHSFAGLEPAVAEAVAAEGYPGVALDLIEALRGTAPRTLVVNVPNAGAIQGLSADDVVEVPVAVSRDFARPLAVGEVPGHCLGLMTQVKAYERLTIAAATEGSYAKALNALTLHPLVADRRKAREILDAYREQHGALFPTLV